MKAASSRVQKALAVAAEICGATLSPAAAEVVSKKLGQHPEDAVLRALDRCIEEVKGRLTLADIIERIEESDGRPSSDVAWSLVETVFARSEGVFTTSLDEARTIVATPEAMQAAAEMRHLDDRVAARMAFRARYDELVAEQRRQRKPVRWEVSLGHDVLGREGPLREAAALGRIEQGEVQRLLGGPAPGSEASPVARLLAGKTVRPDEGVSEEARRALAGIREHLEASIAKEQAEKAARDRERIERLHQRQQETPDEGA